MSNFKGTKGKWIIGVGEPNGHDLSAFRVQSDCLNRWDIAAVWADLKFKESKANAILISKAPEMLDMLEKLSYNLQLSRNQIEEIEQLIKEATEI